MTDERLLEVKACLEEREIWRSVGGQVLEGGYARAFLPECVAEIDHLRKEAATERKRAEFWKAEAQKRAAYLRDLEDVETDPDDKADVFHCPSCRSVPGTPGIADHAPDCKHARLMTMPEEPKL